MRACDNCFVWLCLIMYRLWFIRRSVLTGFLTLFPKLALYNDKNFRRWRSFLQGCIFLPWNRWWGVRDGGRHRFRVLVTFLCLYSISHVCCFQTVGGSKIHIFKPLISIAMYVCVIGAMYGSEDSFIEAQCSQKVDCHHASSLRNGCNAGAKLCHVPEVDRYLVEGTPILCFLVSLWLLGSWRWWRSLSHIRHARTVWNSQTTPQNVVTEFPFLMLLNLPYALECTASNYLRSFACHGYLLELAVKDVATEYEGYQWVM